MKKVKQKAKNEKNSLYLTVSPVCITNNACNIRYMQYTILHYLQYMQYADICNSNIVQSGHPLIKSYESLYMQFIIFALHVISHICNMLRYTMLIYASQCYAMPRYAMLGYLP